TIASSSVKLSWFNNDSGFITNTGTYAANSIITSNASGQLSATGTQLTVGNIIGTTTATSYFLGKLGVGTTTPNARLAVNPIAGDTYGFVVGSTTGTQLSVAAGGFGTTTLSGLNISG